MSVLKNQMGAAFLANFTICNEQKNTHAL